MNSVIIPFSSVSISDSIQNWVAKKLKGKTALAGTKKSIGDFMLTKRHAINVKSNNLSKQNYSPNMVSIPRAFKWVYEEGKKLSFVFVDYQKVHTGICIVNCTAPIPLHEISWKCMSIEAQGYGVIQMPRELVHLPLQTKWEFLEGFIAEYARYRQREIAKHDIFGARVAKYVARRATHPAAPSTQILSASAPTS